MGRRRWQQWSESDARAALSELAGSGESVAGFARRRGFSSERIRYWRRRLIEDGVPAFVAVPVSRGGPAQIEIAAVGVTLRVREDVGLDRLSDLIEMFARHGRGC